MSMDTNIVHKCERCGKLYTLNDLHEIESNDAVIIFKYNRRFDRKESVGMCLSCCKELQKWYENNVYVKEEEDDRN